MLVGEHAIAKRENDYKTMAAILNEEMALPSSKIPTISPEIDQVFKKAVDKNMTLRYQTAEEFKEALTHLFPNLAPGGTGIGIQPLLGGGLNPVVTIGSAPDNDIQFVNNYISRHHLKIKGMDIFVGGKQTYSLAVEDNSKNGTFVDGQKLCRDTKVIPYRSTLDLPQIKLPGRPECILNWEEILSILRQRGWVPGDKPLPKDPPVIGWGILCLIIPFVGWILYGVWREKKPKLASKLNILSSIGFSLYIVVLIILLI